MLLPAGQTLEDIASRFAWDIPEFFNIGIAVSDAWAAREPVLSISILMESPTG